MGLLDGALDNDLTRFGLGLLAASGPTNDPMKGAFGNRLMQAVGSFDDYKQQQAAKARQQMEMERAKQMQEFQAFQMQAMKDQAAQQAAAQKREEEMRQGAAQFFKPGQAGLAPLMGDAETGILPSQGRAPVAPSVDIAGLAGFYGKQGAVDKALPLFASLNKQSEFSPEVRYDQNGRAFMTAKDGSVKFLDGIKARDELVETDLGGKKAFRTKYSPEMLAEIAKTQSPDSVASNAVAWANNRLSRERLDFDKQGGSEGVKPKLVGDQWVTAPSDMKAGEVRSAMPSVQQKDAKEALQLIQTAREIIPKSTGSYFGTGIDQAARVFGASTGGDTAAAQLKALEGALVAKMPKMSGPQSDKDVLLYKQMAGEIGDPTIPQPRKLAALQVIEQIQQRHSGAPAPSMNVTPTNAPTMRWNPKTNSIEMVN